MTTKEKDGSPNKGLPHKLSSGKVYIFVIVTLICANKVLPEIAFVGIQNSVISTFYFVYEPTHIRYTLKPKSIKNFAVRV
ncbi:hypothetical protein A7985_11255 [Pseudoalteromonas luteoviolacea]|uniref:Uncharacterized protein n=1 Tax=Pseudoalteromonas luteoviolacea TaxID=43657 RepID=A0A1C0TQJ0_9GAMM|nr:hypothetical protein A7985_11255 [Pseudoalteromonas luteoviolacea]